MAKKDTSRKQRGREKDEVVFPLSETLLQMPENYGGLPYIEIVQRTVALIPWRSNITLLDKLTDPKLRLWYAQKTVCT